jgi:hypothetical protein
MGGGDVSKPDDVPQDVWDAAVKAELVVEDEFTDLNDWNSRDVATDIIARAIMAERERCAKIADAHAAENWSMTEEEHAAQVIAAAIRKGTP